MEEKKYIDRLYQEKFKDFEASPRKDLWKDIAEKLKEEEKRKPLIPLWWSRIAGVAAILTLVLLLGDWLRQPVSNPAVTSDEEVFRIQELPDRYRQVFNLYALDGYSHKEISDILNISTGTSKSNLARARLILKEKIEASNQSGAARSV